MANNAFKCLQKKIGEITNNSVEHHSDAHSHDILDMSNDADFSIRFSQQNVLPTGNFVDMDKTPYSWSLAFPSLFPPCYIDGEWVILGDITGWHKSRDRNVSKNDWYYWLSWRSDGRPMAHPTFCLMLYNHKRRKGLQAQGRVALASEDIDVTIEAETLSHEWSNG